MTEFWIESEPQKYKVRCSNCGNYHYTTRPSEHFLCDLCKIKKKALDADRRKFLNE